MSLTPVHKERKTQKKTQNNEQILKMPAIESFYASQSSRIWEFFYPHRVGLQRIRGG